MCAGRNSVRYRVRNLLALRSGMKFGAETYILLFIWCDGWSDCARKYWIKLENQPTISEGKHFLSFFFVLSTFPSEYAAQMPCALHARKLRRWGDEWKIINFKWKLASVRDHGAEFNSRVTSSDAQHAALTQCCRCSVIPHQTRSQTHSAVPLRFSWVCVHPLSWKLKPHISAQKKRTASCCSLHSRDLETGAKKQMFLEKLIALWAQQAPQLFCALLLALWWWKKPRNWEAEMIHLSIQLKRYTPGAWLQPSWVFGAIFCLFS